MDISVFEQLLLCLHSVYLCSVVSGRSGTFRKVCRLQRFDKCLLFAKRGINMPGLRGTSLTYACSFS